MNARLARVLLVVAFLGAQHLALAHQIWHAGGVAASAAQQGAGKSMQDRLCEFHGSLCTVLGALSGASTFALPAAPALIAFLRNDVAARSLDAPVPSSRGPPILP